MEEELNFKFDLKILKLVSWRPSFTGPLPAEGESIAIPVKDKNFSGIVTITRRPATP